MVLGQEAGSSCRSSPVGFLLSGNKSINIRYMGLHLEPGSHVPRDLRKSMEQENGLALGSLAPQVGNHACTHREACEYRRTWQLSHRLKCTLTNHGPADFGH